MNKRKIKQNKQIKLEMNLDRYEHTNKEQITTQINTSMKNKRTDKQRTRQINVQMYTHI